jgi:hypothetical protein
MNRYKVTVVGKFASFNTHMTAETKEQIEKAVNDVYKDSYFRITIEEVGATTERGVTYGR